MPTEKTKDNGVKVEGKIFECCNPQNFHRMFGKMGEYFQGQEDVGNFSAMKSNMMKYMMEMCCSSKTAGTKEETEIANEQKGETESSKERSGC